MSADVVFTKENLDVYLSRLAKAFRKLNGKKIPAELILIGGASVLVNYGFREMTYDIDALIHASSAMKDAINQVGDELGLPNGWLNSDFVKTKSFSPKLSQYSKYYKKFGYILEVRTISREYLVAMKLMSGRLYKNDRSDIIGILKEEENNGNPITIDMIETAVTNLYDSWDNLPEDSKIFIKEIFDNGRLDISYEACRKNEINARKSLVEFDKKYPGATNTDNVSEIIKILNKRKEDKGLM